jgi:leader peptidase (prepilin peptidase)/N-methyltransferase
MPWWTWLPLAFFILWVFGLGLAVGSFLNVLIARLPFEKSVIWPGSRCGACRQPLRFGDNLPIIGWLRLRGRCRTCGTHFSSRYLWVELFTGLAFAALFVGEVVLNVHDVPDFKFGLQAGVDPLPPLKAWIAFAVHAALLSLLIASSVIDLQYKIIPTQITVAGTLLGLTASTFFPWPWPWAASAVPSVPGVDHWGHPQLSGRIPIGLTLWPFWGPLFDWAPAGSLQLGLLNGLAGAAAGQLIIRAVKYLFEVGFGKEAMGLGDADLLMMAGAFLGWQVVVLALPLGACVLLPIVLPIRLWGYLAKRDAAADPTIPFGPGLAAGVVVAWLAWPVLGQLVQVAFFEEVILAAMAIIMGGGLLISGTLLALVRGKEP